MRDAVGERPGAQSSLDRRRVRVVGSCARSTVVRRFRRGFLRFASSLPVSLRSSSLLQPLGRERPPGWKVICFVRACYCELLVTAAVRTSGERKIKGKRNEGTLSLSLWCSLSLSPSVVRARSVQYFCWVWKIVGREDSEEELHTRANTTGIVTRSPDTSREIWIGRWRLAERKSFIWITNLRTTHWLCTPSTLARSSISCFCETRLRNRSSFHSVPLSLRISPLRKETGFDLHSFCAPWSTRWVPPKLDSARRAVLSPRVNLYLFGLFSWALDSEGMIVYLFETSASSAFVPRAKKPEARRHSCLCLSRSVLFAQPSRRFASHINRGTARYASEIGELVFPQTSRDRDSLVGIAATEPSREFIAPWKGSTSRRSTLNAFPIWISRVRR